MRDCSFLLIDVVKTTPDILTLVEFISSKLSYFILECNCKRQCVL